MSSLTDYHKEKQVLEQSEKAIELIMYNVIIHNNFYTSFLIENQC